ncbi:conserved hypothetical protein [Candidatus Terasakiella magnetica]|uniref:Uncharacterized protein n=1 Tax=Candidatus Terasakiella magnetica TaxID=1867952 RepID=A0A1C3RDW4_9PROT|nr:hypothetical protein [Candidatus Terasakiella magnetica]SCA55487.1 conserved hypothetical protein [Candidatus Terasakiella magnetica]
MIPELPNKLFSTGRSVLSKFGYVHFEGEESRDDWAEMWEHLKGDFPLEQAQVPSFDGLEPTVREAARDYMKVRLLADHYLDECERLHVNIFKGSIETDLVEKYSLARDRYEHSVEDFGEARVKVQGLLSKNAA